MFRTLHDLSAGLDEFGTVIDVRSPGEFAEDHVPGALNLPVLDDAERAQVGTLYVQQSKFDARRLGAAYIARNVAAHLQGPLREHGGGWAPLLYCWRGGQRSQSMALILSQVGWRTTVLAGGYRTYRRGVVASLYEGARGRGATWRMVRLNGPTGVGKTAMLARLAARGVQTLDLEALANHRGSLFGDMGPQPSQKLFESRLASALGRLDSTRPIVVEAEASRIGDRFLPTAVWAAMQSGPRIDLDAPAPARASALAQTYADLGRDPAHLQDLLARLPGRHGRRRVETWMALAASGDLAALAQALIADHYDPAYARARRDEGAPALARIELADAEDAEAERAADALMAILPGSLL